MQAQAVVDALAELASQLAITSEDIEIVEDAAVTWPNASLGCPRPGMAYTQQLVAGYRLLLQVGANRYHYHAGADRKYFQCQMPQAPYRSEAGGTRHPEA